MFEAIHGSAPRRAGQNLANPSGLLMGAVMMLVHVGLTDVAERVHNAWLRTLEDGVHTYDIYKEGVSREKVGTKEFADAVVARVGQLPQTLKPAAYKPAEGESAPKSASAAASPKKELVGVDVFLDWSKGSANDLGDSLSKARRRRNQTRDDEQSRCESLAGRTRGDLLLRSLALPFSISDAGGNDFTRPNRCVA